MRGRNAAPLCQILLVLHSAHRSPNTKLEEVCIILAGGDLIYFLIKPVRVGPGGAKAVVVVTGTLLLMLISECEHANIKV